jgi:predicted SprT family Zn-dependent metalloprotease
VSQKLVIHFKRGASYILLLTLLLSNTPLNAQDNAGIAKYKPQLELIDSLKSYIAKDLGLYVESNFYVGWNMPDADSMYIYLYVSYSDHVEEDTVYKIPWLFDKETEAIAASEKMRARGYHTLVYKTAGNSFTFLSPKLLSYTPEAIAQIVFHEVVHQNLYKLGKPIPHNYVEALCDVIANMACVKFAEKTKMIDIHAAEKQRDIFERSYAFLNKERTMLDTMQQRNKPELYKTCTNTISVLTADANQFQKDRLNYEVNNAYFLRIADYALNYFRIKKMVALKFDINDMIGRIQELEKK